MLGIPPLPGHPPVNVRAAAIDLRLKSIEEAIFLERKRPWPDEARLALLKRRRLTLKDQLNESLRKEGSRSFETAA